MIPACATLAILSSRKTSDLSSERQCKAKAFSQEIDPHHHNLNPNPGGPAGSVVFIDLRLQSSQSGPLVVRAIDWSITHR